MFNTRPTVLSIAGFDPSAGAGILADVKTFEASGVYGMGIVSAITYQNDNAFEKVEWLSLSQMIEQIQVLQRRFKFEYIKIGLIENLEILHQLILYLLSNTSHSKIIFDPVLNASAGYEFYKNNNQSLLETICSKLYLITPNIPEALQLGVYDDASKNSAYLSTFCNVYLKGGHNTENKGNDILFTKDKKQQITFHSTTNSAFEKHGSGCVLSSAITANLAKGFTLEQACKEAKNYITDFLLSNETLLGYHSNLTTIAHG